MPIMRNPFRKQDENARPVTAGNDQTNSQSETNAKAIDIKDQRPTEYKLSEINDSGVFMPPSPPQRKGFWSTNSFRSTDSSVHRCAFDENEQFNISRESFDSYRRSFDISARSPIIQPAEQRPTRASLDSRGFEHSTRRSLDSRGIERTAPRSSLDSRSLNPPPPRSSNSFRRPSQVPAETAEEIDNFEDVDITEVKPQPAKKRGLFARMVDGVDLHHSERPSSSGGDGNKSSWHHFGGRKRGQSGQGAELGAVSFRPSTPKATDTQPRKEVDSTKPNMPPSQISEARDVKNQSEKPSATATDAGQTTEKTPVVPQVTADSPSITENSRAPTT